MLWLCCVPWCQVAWRSSAQSVSCVSLPKWIFSLQRHFWPPSKSTQPTKTNHESVCYWLWFYICQSVVRFSRIADLEKKAMGLNLKEDLECRESRYPPWRGRFRSEGIARRHVAACSFIDLKRLHESLACCFCSGTGKKYEEWPKVEPNVESARSSEWAAASTTTSPRKHRPCDVAQHHKATRHWNS